MPHCIQCTGRANCCWTRQTAYFVLDASPWCLGGILLCNQVPQEYVTIALSNKNVALFVSGRVIRQDNRCRKPSPRKRMATAEMCLSCDVTLVVNMRPRTRQPRACAGTRRISFFPLVAQHLPGIANTMADALSRRAQPMSSVTLASFLKEVTPVFPPVREAASHNHRSCHANHRFEVPSASPKYLCVIFNSHCGSFRESFGRSGCSQSILGLSICFASVGVRVSTNCTC